MACTICKGLRPMSECEKCFALVCAECATDEARCYNDLHIICNKCATNALCGCDRSTWCILCSSCYIEKCKRQNPCFFCSHGLCEFCEEPTGCDRHNDTFQCEKCIKIVGCCANCKVEKHEMGTITQCYECKISYRCRSCSDYDFLCAKCSNKDYF
jgi:hypothetical protein